MASKTYRTKCSFSVKAEKIKENNLAKKIQLELERDLLRLFENSVFCDIKITVNTSYLSAHSCILQTRAYKFYKFICNEFEVLNQNGISVFKICNASFSYIKTFIQNIYTNIHTANVEDNIIKYLQGCKKVIQPSADTDCVPDSSLIPPEVDLFFTPRCSPTDFQKPFVSSAIKIKDSNVVSYYKIVSVDDIPTEEKSEVLKTEDNIDIVENNILEQELAEQDELLLLFKTKFRQKAKEKPKFFSSYLNSSQSTKKLKPKSCKKTNPNSRQQNIEFYVKNKFFQRSPNASSHFEINSKGKTINTKCMEKNSFENFPAKTQTQDFCLTETIKTDSTYSSSEMDVNKNGCDSGLDNSSLYQSEATFEESKTSDCSKVISTDLNDDFSSEIYSSDRSLSTEMSPVSEVRIWDGNEIYKKKNQPIIKTVINNRNGVNLKPKTLEFNGIKNKNTLSSEALNCLNEEKDKIKECEIFLCTERDHSNKFQNESHHQARGDVIEVKYYEYNNQDINYLPCQTNGKLNNELSHIEETGHYFNDVTENGKNYSKDSYFDKSLADNELMHSGGDFKETKLNDRIQNICSNDDENESRERLCLEETKTPPCTPKKLKFENSKVEERIEFTNVSSSKFENSYTTGINNYFIDASSLLDDDEFSSPPSISFVNVKMYSDYEGNESPNDRQDLKSSVTDVPNFFYSKPNETKDETVLLLENEESQRGNVAFKTSSPTFYKFDEKMDNQSAENETKESLSRAPNSLNSDADSFECRQSSNRSNSIIETHFFESPEGYKSPSGDEYPERNFGNWSFTSLESTTDLLNNENLIGSQQSNDFASMVSGETSFDEKTKEKKFNRCPGKAWIVMFNDGKKYKNKSFTSPLITTMDDVNYDNKNKQVTPQKELVEENIKNIDENLHSNNAKEKTEFLQKENFPIEKSNSLGYFLDFGKFEDQKPSQNNNDNCKSLDDKRNLFSTFIELNDNAKPSSSYRKAKKFTESVKVSDESCSEESKDAMSSNMSSSSEGQDKTKKSFYMFIESDSPQVKRRPMPKNLEKFQAEIFNKKSLIRTESYTIESRPKNAEKLEPVDCTLSDNGALSSEQEIQVNDLPRERLLTNKAKSNDEESKITAWSETKILNNEVTPAESWLNTKDILVNYTGKSNDKINELFSKKKTTFIVDNVKSKKVEKFTGESSTDQNLKQSNDYSDIVSNPEDQDVSFVKLSDMDKQIFDYKTNRRNDIMSQSMSDNYKYTPELKKHVPNRVSSVSKDDEDTSEKPTSKGIRINRSLSRLFPNLSTQSLASLSRKDGYKGDKEIQGSEYSETSASLHSSMGPSGLDVSTSETDVSSQNGNSLRLGEDLLRMFLEEIGPDVVVEVAGRRIKAHKCILSSRCQYFAATLSGGWVESAGNVISLQGFTYNAVHFALRYIYSGESRIPESLNIVELATLANMLCLDGLQEIISYNLKVKYCHSFHVPCSKCSVGVFDCLPIASAYGLDDLYRKCLRWITKYFVKLWPTKSFGNLPKELLEKCYQHYVVHMTVENVLDTVVNVDKVRGSLTNVRWADTVSRLVKKLNEAAVRYIAEHFSSILISDNFLALGREDDWNLGRMEDSLVEAIRHLPPEQACWSHAQLHRILSVANGPDPPPEMNWNQNFLRLLQVIAKLVENSLIKQAPRASKSKAWRQLEPELRIRIQEAACLVLPDVESSPNLRKPHFVKKSFSHSNVPQSAKSRILEIRQIKLAMSEQINRNQNVVRPLSLRIEQKAKNNSRLVPLGTSASTSSVRKTEQMEHNRKMSCNQASGNPVMEIKKFTNPRYSEVKSRYLEPKSPQKSAPEKAFLGRTSNINQSQRRNLKNVSSDSSRNYSPALRPSNSKTAIPSNKKLENNRQNRNLKKNEKLLSNKSVESPRKLSEQVFSEDYMSTDSLCTDSLQSDKDATFRRKSQDGDFAKNGKENLIKVLPSFKNLPPSRSKGKDFNVENRTSSAAKLAQKLIVPVTSKSSVKEACNRNSQRTSTTEKSPGAGNQAKRRGLNNQKKPNVTSSRTVGDRNHSGKFDADSTDRNRTGCRKSEIDSENNHKSASEEHQTPFGVSRSGTFLKEEPTILKKPETVNAVNGRF